MTQDRKAEIRRLNDRLRIERLGGIIAFTAGVNALDMTTKHTALRAIAAFSDFTEDNDPHGEHDFGAIEVAGQLLFWKIDYYDPELERHSDDPAEPAVTRRVLTVMLACEY